MPSILEGLVVVIGLLLILGISLTFLIIHHQSTPDEQDDVNQNSHYSFEGKE